MNTQDETVKVDISFLVNKENNKRLELHFNTRFYNEESRNGLKSFLNSYSITVSKIDITSTQALIDSVKAIADDPYLHTSIKEGTDLFDYDLDRFEVYLNNGRVFEIVALLITEEDVRLMFNGSDLFIYDPVSKKKFTVYLD